MNKNKISPKQFIETVNNSYYISKDELIKLISGLLDPLDGITYYDDCIIIINLFNTINKLENDKNNQISRYLHKFDIYSEPILFLRYWNFTACFSVRDKKLYLNETYDIDYHGRDVTFNLLIGEPNVDNVTKMWDFLMGFGCFYEENLEIHSLNNFYEKFNRLQFDNFSNNFENISIKELKDKLYNMSFDISIPELKNMTNKLLDPCAAQKFPEIDFLCSSLKNDIINIFTGKFSCDYRYYYRDIYIFTIIKDSDGCDACSCLELYIKSNFKLFFDMSCNNIIGDANIDVLLDCVNIYYTIGKGNNVNNPELMQLLKNDIKFYKKSSRTRLD